MVGQVHVTSVQTPIDPLVCHGPTPHPFDCGNLGRRRRRQCDRLGIHKSGRRAASCCDRFHQYSNSARIGRQRGQRPTACSSSSSIWCHVADAHAPKTTHGRLTVGNATAAHPSRQAVLVATYRTSTVLYASVSSLDSRQLQFSRYYAFDVSLVQRQSKWTIALCVDPNTRLTP